jgi:16S rRNA (uracil1498-N3)-methyltransferase
LQNPPFRNASELSLFIGPEGGFPAAEKELAQQNGIAVASLGKRILRAETAGLAAVSAVLYETGEMG